MADFLTFVNAPWCHMLCKCSPAVARTSCAYVQHYGSQWALHDQLLRLCYHVFEHTSWVTLPRFSLVKICSLCGTEPQKAFLVPFLFRFWHFFQAAVCLQDLAQCSQWTKNSWSGQSWNNQRWWEASWWKEIADAHTMSKAMMAAKLQASVAVHALLFIAHYTWRHKHSEGQLNFFLTEPLGVFNY